MKEKLFKIGKLNNITLFIVLVAYVSLLTFILVTVIPTKNYSVNPDYPHTTDISEVEIYYQVRHRYSYTDTDGLSYSISTRYYATSNVSREDISDASLDIIKITGILSTKNKSNYYYAESVNKITPAAMTSNISNTADPTAAFFKIRYSDKEEKEQTLCFKEEMFSDPKNTRGFNDVNTVEFNGTTFSFEACKTREDDINLVSMHVYNNAVGHYHLDLQTWIVTEEGEVYPFVGIYGFTEGNTWRVYDEEVPTNMHAKYILAEMKVYYNGEVKSLKNKVAINSLSYNYENYERVVEKEKSNLWAVYTGIGICVTGTVITLCVLNKKKKEN